METNEIILPAAEATDGSVAARALETAFDGKVDKQEGKGLSSNDYTAAEKAKLAGMPVLDYTSLEEQLVPGEFWLGSDGVKRQVYFRTFRGTTSDTVSSVLISDVAGFRIVDASIDIPYYGIKPNTQYISETTIDDRWMYQIYLSSGSVVLFHFGADTRLQPYVITLKYTKA